MSLTAMISIEGYACSNILVTKGASTDGSCMISYAADSHQLYGELYYLKGGFWDKGATRDVTDWDTGKFLGRIPQAPVTYQRVGNMNEHQLIGFHRCNGLWFIDIHRPRTGDDGAGGD